MQYKILVCDGCSAETERIPAQDPRPRAWRRISCEDAETSWLLCPTCITRLNGIIPILAALAQPITELPPSLVALAQAFQKIPDSPEAEERLLPDPHFLAFYQVRIKALMAAVATGTADLADFYDVEEKMPAFQQYFAERMAAELTKAPDEAISDAALEGLRGVQQS